MTTIANPRGMQLGFVFTLSLEEEMDFYYDKVDVLELQGRQLSQPFRLEEGEVGRIGAR